MFIKFWGFQIFAYFFLPSVVVEFLGIVWFSLNKSCKMYLRKMLPPGGKNWQLISLNYSFFHFWLPIFYLFKSCPPKTVNSAKFALPLRKWLKLLKIVFGTSLIIIHSVMKKFEQIYNFSRIYIIFTNSETH